MLGDVKRPDADIALDDGNNPLLQACVEQVLGHGVVPEVLALDGGPPRRLLLAMRHVTKRCFIHAALFTYPDCRRVISVQF